MDGAIEKQLCEIFCKEQRTNAEWKLLEEESQRYAPKLSEVLEHDEPDMTFQGCRIRALETARILFVVWCSKKTIKSMSPIPYRLYGMDRQSGVFTPAAEVDYLRYSLGIRL